MTTNPIEEIYTAFVTLGQVIANTLVEPMQQLIPHLQQMHDLMWTIYRDAGQPYGDTEDGLHRWLSEIVAAYRHTRQAERILQHPQLLARPSSPLHPEEEEQSNDN